MDVAWTCPSSEWKLTDMRLNHDTTLQIEPSGPEVASDLMFIENLNTRTTLGDFLVENAYSKTAGTLLLVDNKELPGLSIFLFGNGYWRR